MAADAGPAVVTVETGGRLHFGLTSFGWPERAQHGGLGLMIDRPEIRLRVTASDRLEVAGPLADRAREFAQRWHQSQKRTTPLACRLEILAAPPQHVGLGTGTQLGLAVAAGLHQFATGQRPAAAQLARDVGRGLRSSIGTIGFDHGGLIYDGGKVGRDRVAPHQRVELPAAWCFVQFRPTAGEGWSGDQEVQAFGHLPPVPPSVTQQLVARIENDLLPAAVRADFERFSEGLYAFGYQAGSCFAPCQDGAFASPLQTRWVDQLRRRGYRGVGQSSWGPTIYVLVPSAPAAQELIDWFLRDVADVPVQVEMAQALSRGARVTDHRRPAR